ncbi:MAG: hypothetical protein WGN25_09110 [Candidatus Electrothrix sp. GW3-4]|uniref:hypothetical protein n=1 Tax=Candidatus Electrothrix sp. GW3-4 TaxID=3126740 RepID=UPI0030CCB417
MVIEKTIDEIADLIAEALRIHVSEHEGAYVFNLNEVNVDKIIHLPKDELQQIIDSLSLFESQDETIISTNKVYETLVREESSFPRMRPRVRDDALRVTDSDNNIEYCLSSPSNEYLVFLLIKVSEVASTRSLVMPMPLRRVFERPREEEITNIFDVLRRIIGRFLTLRLDSTKNRTVSEFEKYSSAFLFQLSYNMDAALVPQRHLVLCKS